MKKFTYGIIGAILSMLGFTSCDPLLVFEQKDMYGPGPIRPEYGCPSAVFKFSGDAVNEEGEPIPGIRVVVSPREDNEWETDTLYTNASGHAELGQLKYTWPDTDVIQVVFQDVDGKDNGSYEDKTLKKDDLEIEQTGEGSGAWYEGEFTIRAKAVMQKKTDGEE